MSQYDLTIQNLKCGGCKNTITKNLSQIGMKNIDVIVEESKVRFTCEDENADALSQAIGILEKLGYPVFKEGQDPSLSSKVKSYVSCAVGKIEGE